ncbi:hypothetical protein Pst134EA_019374 [Puccinia striiformis f. sp. tritici]|uniref:hypothetical protein n=1 Tax=Puccinia striiformis f. sp. tritici TaxID=168172 RepID=UPI0020086001|nr:hypothetical protein Pst134EA_019374 [Puccinia striiformis f. sp. tritici]KAH9449436.1 hypothetical protein Pst134EB_020258 [Puccinia striiformis f. sp. tritici]KAH9459224.1 hypothetical protein Pst134EA_019374 [Puccinia striiformis f. sp. tritici]
MRWRMGERTPPTPSSTVSCTRTDRHSGLAVSPSSIAWSGGVLQHAASDQE